MPRISSVLGSKKPSPNTRSLVVAGTLLKSQTAATTITLGTMNVPIVGNDNSDRMLLLFLNTFTGGSSHLTNNVTVNGRAATVISYNSGSYTVCTGWYSIPLLNSEQSVTIVSTSASNMVSGEVIGFVTKGWKSAAPINPTGLGETFPGNTRANTSVSVTATASQGSNIILFGCNKSYSTFYTTPDGSTLTSWTGATSYASALGNTPNGGRLYVGKSNEITVTGNTTSTTTVTANWYSDNPPYIGLLAVTLN